MHKTANCYTNSNMCWGFSVQILYTQYSNIIQINIIKKKKENEKEKKKEAEHVARYALLRPWHMHDTHLKLCMKPRL